MSARVIFDTTFLLVLFDPNTRISQHPDTGKQVELAKERIDGLIKQFQQSRTKICIPTPALSELLIGAGSSLNDYISAITTNSNFRLLSFDEKAAIECSLIASKELKSGEKDKTITNAKLKFDRQILSIALSENIETIYSDDNTLAKLAKKHGIRVIKIYEVEIPDEAKQTNLKL